MSSDNPCKNVTDPQPVPRTTIFGRLPLLWAAGLSLLKVLIPAATEAAAPTSSCQLAGRRHLGRGRGGGHGGADHPALDLGIFGAAPVEFSAAKR